MFESVMVNEPYVPVSILHKSIAGRYGSVRVADGRITARCRFIKNGSWGVRLIDVFTVLNGQLWDLLKS